MKRSEVKRILHLSNPTICKYYNEGIIKGKKMPNGQIIYDDKSVYDYLGIKRQNIIYVNKKHEDKLKNLIDFSASNGYQIDEIFDTNDIDSLNKILTLIEENKVSKIIIYNLDNVPIKDENILNNICNFHNTQIIQFIKNNKGE